MKTLTPVTVKSSYFENDVHASELISSSRCRLRGVMIQRFSRTSAKSLMNDTMIEFRNGTTVSGELIWNNGGPERDLRITTERIYGACSWVDLPGLGVLFDIGLFINVTFDNSGTDADGDVGFLVNTVLSR